MYVLESCQGSCAPMILFMYPYILCFWFRFAAELWCASSLVNRKWAQIFYRFFELAASDSNSDRPYFPVVFGMHLGNFKAQCAGLSFFSLRSTTVPIFMVDLSFNHLLRTCSSFKYSKCQRAQKFHLSDVLPCRQTIGWNTQQISFREGR